MIDENAIVSVVDIDVMDRESGMDVLYLYAVPGIRGIVNGQVCYYEILGAADIGDIYSCAGTSHIDMDASSIKNERVCESSRPFPIIECYCIRKLRVTVDP
jgi:hypothetical protein